MKETNLETEIYTCESCQGAGSYSVGDCEDGYDETCPECAGTGAIVESI